MHKQSPIIISIPTPCHESWEAMTPADKGRFCQSCQKTVTDFSGMSDQQIMSYLKQRQGEVCGRFHAEQLNREISVPVNTRRQPFMSIAAIVTALTVAVPAAQAKTTTEKIQLAPDGLPTTPQYRDTTPHIRGIVIDSIDKNALPGANITFREQGITTISDRSGKFELYVPQSYKGTSVTLEIRYIGYLLSEFVVPLSDAKREIEFSMEPIKTDDMQVLIAGGISVVHRERANFWQRFKYKVGHFFR